MRSEDVMVEGGVLLTFEGEPKRVYNLSHNLVGIETLHSSQISTESWRQAS